MTETNQSFEEDSDDDGSGRVNAKRRGILAGVAGLGLLSTVGSASASTASGDHLGDSWAGSPGTGYGLKVKLRDGGKALQGVAGVNTNNNSDIGVQGFSYSTDGVWLFGHAMQSSGDTRGLVGRVDSPDGTALQGRATATGTGNSVAVEGRNAADQGVAIRGLAASSSTTNYGVKGETNSPDGYGLYTPDDAKVDGTMEIGGDLNVSGQKHFVQTVSTTNGPKQVAYTAVEAGEAHTETNDVAEMEDGVAVVELPDHFGMVTSGEKPLTVQVTPYADERVHPQVTDKSTERIVVKDFGDAPDDYSFAYTVKGIRHGFEDEETVRDLK
jgi:hypothetical protein